MPNKVRPEVTIPDHEVLRKIGGGSYGEVWLARGVTGAWRAVKIVWREDFEDERGFEREFDGILKFEPISRDHPGLVNVLHVGRSKEGEDPFYYYVMELGDDIRQGRDINPVEYEARTLRSDLVTANGKPLDLEFCLEAGIRLSNALVHLHNKGLAHRDVKPSNVIFVGGKAKLADIGLVAARGQRTFVGTEGFVPPEGPGTAQADIYSLGKVLYEMITGKDRLQFPELPDDMPSSSEQRKLLLAFNQVICEICEPRVSKRNITTAEQLSEALERLQRGKKLRLKRTSLLSKSALAVVLLAGAGVALWQTKPWAVKPKVVVVNTKAPETQDDRPKYQNEHCALQFTSDPPGASVYEDGVLLEEITPTDFRDYKPGTEITLRFELNGYKPYTTVFEVPDKDFDAFPVVLEKFTPPIADMPWIDPFGATYLPVGETHLSGYIEKSRFEPFLKKHPKVSQFGYVPFSQNGEEIEVVLLGNNVAKRYAKWLEKQSLENGYLETDQMIVAKQDPDLVTEGYGDEQKKAGLYPFRCEVKKIPYAVMEIVSDPIGARVYVEDEWLGVTPLKTEKKIRPGKVTVELRMDGYRKHEEELNLADNEVRPYTVKLKRNNGVIFGQKWENGLGMRMVPVTKTMMASEYEVRLKDYEQFTKSSGHRQPKSPGFEQGPDHPVVGVNRQDAIAFCNWLTDKERKEERISDKHRYKLPTDAEWSLFYGVEEKEGISPWERNFKARNNPVLANRMLWQGVYPPNKIVGNLADESAAHARGIKKSETLSDYDDGYENTAPVGKFEPNTLGLYDLCGNAYEWVEDNYKLEGDTGTVRGGSWATYAEHLLLFRNRFEVSATLTDNQYGFRVILIDESITTPPTQEDGSEVDEES